MATVLKGEKFSVEITKGRPDPIRVTVTTPKGKSASHHLRPDEVECFIYALRKAIKTSK